MRTATHVFERQRRAPGQLCGHRACCFLSPPSLSLSLSADSVAHSVRMALRDSFDELSEIFSRLVLGEASLLDDPVEELAARTVLGDDVDGRRRRQHLQQLDHGRMLDQLHDRNLQAEACTEKTTDGSDAEQVKRRHGCGSGFPAPSASASAAAVRVRSFGDLLLDLFAHVVRTNLGFIENFNGDKSTRFRVRRKLDSTRSQSDRAAAVSLVHAPPALYFALSLFLPLIPSH